MNRNRQLRRFSVLTMVLLFVSTAYAESCDALKHKLSSGEVICIEVPTPPKATADIPKPVEVVTVGSSSSSVGDFKIEYDRKFEHKRNKKIVFSKRVPPNFNDMTFSQKERQVGDIKNARVSLYLRGKYLEVGEVEKRLQQAGFKVLDTIVVDKKRKLYSVVFTCNALEAMAKAPNRGFAASMRVLVDGVNKQISITNPLYITRAFMQNDFKMAIADTVLDDIRKAFNDVELVDSKDLLKFNLLPKYVFMNGMPGYQDMVEIYKGDHQKVMAQAKKSKYVFFVQELSPTQALIAVKLGRRTMKFVGKIGVQNAGLLPYMVRVENGEVTMLDPKYYIAVMYPLLKMGTFMKISTVPGAIVNDIKKVFK